MALDERLRIFLETVGATTVVRDLDRVSRSSGGIGPQARTGAKGLDTLGASGLASSVALKAGVAAAATIATARLVDFGRAAIDAASALQEQMTAVPFVFGAAADSVVKFANESAGALGLSRSEALASMNVLGSYFKNVGASGEVAAGASQSIVQLAADVASFRDVAGGVPEVLNRIQSGLRGETEAIERLGVNVSAVAVKAKAAELGLGGVGRELTEGEKVAARYALIFEQTADAQGDMARTSGSLANQQRKLRADIELVKEELGSALIPAATNAVYALRGLIEVGRDVGGAMGSLNRVLEQATDGMVNFGAITARAINAILPGMPALVGWLIKQGKAADADAAAMEGLIDQIDIQAGLQQTTADTIKDTNSALLDASKAQRAYDASARAVTAAERSLVDARKEYNELLKEGAVDEEKVADAIRSHDDAVRSLRKANRELARSQEEYNDAQAAFLALPSDTNADALRDASDNLADAQDSVASAAGRETEAALELAKARAGDPEFNDKLATAKQRVTDAEISLKDAQYNSAEAAFELEQKLTTQNTALAENAGAVASVRSEWEALLAKRPEIAAFLAGPIATAAPAAAVVRGLPPTSTGRERRYGVSPQEALGLTGPAAPASAPSGGGGGTPTIQRIGDVVINITQAVTDPVNLAKKIVWNLN